MPKAHHTQPRFNADVPNWNCLENIYASLSFLAALSSCVWKPEFFNMPRNPRSRKRQRRQLLAPNKPEPEPEFEVEPESEPETIRLYGDTTGDTFVDYETTNPQSQCGLLSKLPAEIRALIYQELWREAGLSQHLLPHTVFPEGFGVTRYHHARCITKHRRSGRQRATSREPALQRIKTARTD